MPCGAPTSQQSDLELCESFTLLAQKTESVILFTDAERKIVWVNEAFSAMTGYSREEVLGRNPSFLQGKETDPAAIEKMHLALAQGKGIKVVILNYTKSGTPYWLDLEIIPRYDHQGVLVGFMAIQTNITEKIAAIESARQLGERNRDILQVALDGFCIIDPQGNILQANQAYCQMTGYSAEELACMEISDLEQKETLEETIAHMQKIIAHGEDRFETSQRCKDGSVIEVEVSAQYRSTENVFVAFLKDITATKVLLRKFEHLNQLYKALAQCNEAILQCHDRDELFTRICKTVVENGGIKMAWVGFFDEPTGLIYPVASFGEGVEYLDGIQISLNTLDPLGQGPTGTAMREGRPVWCPDFQNNPSTMPWHERGAQYEWKASAAIPFRLRGRILGVITFFISSDQGFDEDIRELLIRMGNNISFALDNFAHEEDRKAAVEEHKKLHAAVEQSEEIIVITDIRGDIEYVNPAFEKITGYTSAEVIGCNPRILKSGEQSQAFYKELWDTLHSGNTWRGEFHNRRKNGDLYWVAAVISPVYSEAGEVSHFVVVQEDITKRKITEARLQQALERAESASQAKSEFLAVMSHELRTPLNGVLGFSEILSDTILDEEQRGYVRTINDCGEHLLSIVTDILDFSSIEKGKLKIESECFEIKTLLESCHQTLSYQAETKKLDFRLEISPNVPTTMKGDAVRVRQILTNLLGNALKFTSEGSVVLRAETHAIEGINYISFSIIDTGSGMTPETLALLFQPFSQGDSSLKRAFEGTGLGLAISKRLADAMGGSIAVDSAPGKGSTFTCRIPLNSTILPLNADQIEELTPASEPTGGLVLVVEDDRVNSLLARKMLEFMGMKVEAVSNGKEAVEAYRPGKYAAILMDMQMPVMDGVDATLKIREIDTASGTHVPIIALTANALQRDRDRCMTAGMDDFISKPFKKDELAEKLSKLI